MSENRSVNKGIVTTLTVKLMPDKTVKDMWTDFFKGNVPADFFGTSKIEYFFKDMKVHPELYTLILNKFGEDSFVVSSIEKKTHTEFNTRLMLDEIYKVIPFVTIKRMGKNESNYIHSGINRYSLEVRLDREKEIQVVIDTRSYDMASTEDDIKILNKENARNLRKYFVSLPSVQGVPYSCTYKDNSETERSCEV